MGMMTGHTIQLLHRFMIHGLVSDIKIRRAVAFQAYITAFFFLQVGKITGMRGMAGLAVAPCKRFMLAGGSITFPIRYRGIATTLMLAMFDIGSLVGQPTVGAIIRGASLVHLPGYSTMFVTVSILLWALAGFYRYKTRLRA